MEACDTRYVMARDHGTEFLEDQLKVTNTTTNPTTTSNKEKILVSNKMIQHAVEI